MESFNETLIVFPSAARMSNPSHVLVVILQKVVWGAVEMLSRYKEAGGSPHTPRHLPEKGCLCTPSAGLEATAWCFCRYTTGTREIRPHHLL